MVNVKQGTKRKQYNNRDSSNEDNTKSRKPNYQLNIVEHVIHANNNIHNSPFKRLAFNKNKTLLAAARFNSEIEIYSVDATIYQNGNVNEKFKEFVPLLKLPGKIGTTVETMIWTHDDRFFTCGLHGYVTEWDLEKQIPKRISSPSGGAIWNMDLINDVLAIASEDGGIRFLNVEDLSLKFIISPSVKNNNHQGLYEHCKDENRMLFVRFLENGKKVLCGGINGIYCFDVLKKTVLYRIEIKRGFCWTGELLNNNTAVVGDSVGNIHIVDIELGMIKQTMKALNRDVLKIYSEKESEFFVAGMDGSMVFVKKEKKKYALIATKRPSLNDIFDLVISGKSIYFVGLEGNIIRMPTSAFYAQIVKNSFNKELIPLMNSKHQIIKVSNENRLVLLDHLDNYFTVMHLADIGKEKTNSLTECTEIVAQFKVKSKAGWYSSSSAISSSGKYIAVTSIDTVYLFEFDITTDEDGILQMKLEKQLNVNQVVPGHFVEFVNEDYLIVTSKDHKLVQIYDIKEEKLKTSITLPEINIEVLGKSTPFNTFANSINGLITNSNHIIVSKGNRVLTYSISEILQDNFKPYFEVELQQHNGFPYRLQFLDNNRFYILTIPNRCTVFDIEKKRTEYLKLSVKEYPILSVFEINDLFLLDNPKLSIVAKGTEIVGARNYAVNHFNLGTARLNQNELVTVWVDSEDLANTRAPVIYRKRYGA
ncbi:hypothetical protein ABK040_014701 [Willaertia magna]